MEPFVVSALKYRPQNFDDVIGQQAITQTLQNAIDQDHLAQALLFCGPRGVGKTTCARILAKKINSEQETNEDYAFNIFELDAASNNTVDDIRSLIDQVRIPPQVGQYKVYIIDEVHMLSTSAFNAFLKTLEEPPKHAIFILATTEKQKIIPTILSRCQIYDFKRIGVIDAKNYLAKIARNEGIQAEDEALHIIAQKADGAMRDALSIFDRIVSFSGNKLSVEHVSINLSILDYDTYFKTTELLIQSDIPQVLLLFNDILSKGFDGHQFINGLASHFRDLWMCKSTSTQVLMEVSDEIREKYAQQCQQIDYTFLQEALEMTSNCDLRYKSSKNQRLLVELCLMQLASMKGEKKKHKHYIIPPQTSKIQHSRPKQELAQNRQVTAEKRTQEKNSEKTKEIIVKEKCVPKVKLAVKTQQVSGLSLSSLKFKKNHQHKLQSPSSIVTQNEDISQKQLEIEWKNYIDQLIRKGAFNKAALLNLDQPRLKNKLHIHLCFPNKTNLVEMSQNKEELIDYLKSKLKNDFIQLVINVDEKEVKNYVFTSHDKYNKLVEINPLIESFRKEFELEI